MTKRRPKTECSVEDGVTVEYRHSASIHVVDREITEDTCLALWEQLFEMQAAPNDIAKLLASKLRETPPDPRLLNMLALMLDPKIDSHFKLVIKRQRDGRRGRGAPMTPHWPSSPTSIGKRWVASAVNSRMRSRQPPRALGSAKPPFAKPCANSK